MLTLITGFSPGAALLGTGAITRSTLSALLVHAAVSEGCTTRIVHVYHGPAAAAALGRAHTSNTTRNGLSRTTPTASKNTPASPPSSLIAASRRRCYAGSECCTRSCRAALYLIPSTGHECSALRWSRSVAGEPAGEAAVGLRAEAGRVRARALVLVRVVVA